MTAAANSQISDREIVITREFDAGREFFWDVWTEPKHVEKWFGPVGFTTKVPNKTSNRWQIGLCNDRPGRNGISGKGFYKEVVRPERIVSTDEFGDDLMQKESIFLKE